jgi:tRNA pseudouridine-54 N-methylase
MAVEELVPKYQKYYQSIMIQGGEQLAQKRLSSKLEYVAKDHRIIPEEKQEMLEALAQVKINLQL